MVYLYILFYTFIGMDSTIPSDQSKEIIRVSISEAARLFGVNAQTIRRAISAQEITYVVVGGRYKLNFESLVKWSQRRTTVRNKLARHGIGQFVEQWKIKNPLFSPNPKTVATTLDTSKTEQTVSLPVHAQDNDVPLPPEPPPFTEPTYDHIS